MKLEVGMYVRYKNFTNISQIAKITNISYSDNKDYTDYCQFDNNDGTLEEFIEKASYNIMDLIEVGDVIKYTHPCREKTFLWELESDGILEQVKLIIKEKNINLKEVLTKEQFEKESYKVG